MAKTPALKALSLYAILGSALLTTPGAASSQVSAPVLRTPATGAESRNLDTTNVCPQVYNDAFGFNSLGPYRRR